MGKLCHLRGIFAVEHRHQRVGGTEHHRIQRCRKRQRRAAAENEQLFRPGAVALAVAFAYQRLRALCHAVEDGRCHQCKVCNDAVGRHRHITGQTQQQEVEHRSGDAGAHLAHKAGDAQLATLPQQFCRGQLPHKCDVVLLF